MAFVGGVTGGVTVTLVLSGGSPPAISLNPTSVSGFNPTIPAVSTTLVTSTNFAKKKAGVIMEHEPITITCMWDGGELDDLFDGNHGTRIIGRTGTLTITYPKTHDAGVGNPSLTGTGFLASASMPELTPNGLLMTEMVFHFDGGTGPTFTSEVIA